MVYGWLCVNVSGKCVLGVGGGCAAGLFFLKVKKQNGKMGQVKFSSVHGSIRALKKITALWSYGRASLLPPGPCLSPFNLPSPLSPFSPSPSRSSQAPGHKPTYRQP